MYLNHYFQISPNIDTIKSYEIDITDQEFKKIIDEMRKRGEICEMSSNPKNYRNIGSLKDVLKKLS